MIRLGTAARVLCCACRRAQHIRTIRGSYHGESPCHSFRQPTCEEFDPTQSRAVIWEGTRAVDLNSLVPKRFAREFQLSTVAAINDRGQIVARGVRRGEAKMPCPRVDFDFETGENVYNDSIFCQNEYAFLLTPERR